MAEPSAEPSNRTILLIDMEGSGGRRDTEQAVIRRMLYAVLHETLSAAAIEPTEYRCEDRGDGVFVLIDPSVPKPALLRSLLTTTPERLVSNNRLAAECARIRLRIVVHSGEVALDDFGAVGGDVVHAFRLLDAPALRTELRRTPEPSVLCVSEAVFRGVVRHAHPGVRPEHFHPLTVDSKEGVTLRGWYHDNSVRRTDPAEDGSAVRRAAAAKEDRSANAEPANEDRSAHAGPVASPANAASASERTPDSGGSAAHGSAPVLHTNTGNFFLGTASFAGDAVAGDKYVGVDPAEPRRQHGTTEGTDR